MPSSIAFLNPCQVLDPDKAQSSMKAAMIIVLVFYCVSVLNFSPMIIPNTLLTHTYCFQMGMSDQLEKEDTLMKVTRL